MAYKIISEVGFSAPFGFVESESYAGWLNQGFHDSILPFDLWRDCGRLQISSTRRHWANIS
ncbi:hypothetical protein BDU57DRAFT_516904 [Ampelomyces quisqualis]|uniref:Uncharacterized protein n=1 Tax=Ampelomyces quisqualis TaxID=50730 RepID=A0A6A5QPP3_AMPQU|nr:hypothetical protein BDU57DRAFT_516904 [Ampelomyces quisqualis]